MKKSMYVNIWDYESDRYPFQIFIGGRGLGKTFSALRGAKDRGNPFIFMRRTPQEMELLLDQEKKGEGLNPFKPINRLDGCNIGLHAMSKKVAGIYNREEAEEGRFLYEGSPIGYGLAMTAIASIRGIDLQECTDWIYDEFIPEEHVKKMRGEFDALMNAYETINRNKELEGKPPIHLWMLANAFNIYNPIFVGLNIVNVCEKMIARGQVDKYFPDRGLAIHLLPASEEFKEKKKQTALYKLTRGTKFEEMSLENKFAYNDFSLIKWQSTKGWIPICSLSEKAYIYHKKGERRIYVSYASAKCPNFNVDTEQGRRAFLADCGNSFASLFTSGRITFESYDLKSLVLDLIL